ncbi:MAG: response regulator, partial [Desulforhopalus sp.]
MLRSINSKFYLIAGLLLLYFIVGDSVLVYFLRQQSRSIILARDAVQLERNISALDAYYHQIRFWEQAILFNLNPEADKSFAENLNQIRTILATMDNRQLNDEAKTWLIRISDDIDRYETRFNELFQLRTKQSVQGTKMGTNYRSMVSVVLNSNNTSLLKPLFNFNHYLLSYNSSKDQSKYMALKMVIESLEKKIGQVDGADGRMHDYLKSFNSALDQNYAMELEMHAINREVENITRRLRGYFADISLESENLIREKLAAVVDIKQELERILLLSSLLSLLFLMLLVSHISRSIIAPVKVISRVVQSVEEGNIGARFESDAKKKDEIIDLGNSLNTMLGRLEENNAKLLDYQRQLEEKIHEISTRERESRQLAAKIQRIEKMEAIGTLAGGVAHDLNNILSGIVSYPELLLLDMPEESPYRQPILTIQESGKKAAAIVQDLLTLARRGVTVTDVTNLNSLIRDYLSTPEYKALLSDHPAVEVQVDLADDLSNISGSPFHLTKTIMNLMVNGMESIKKKGIVRIQTRNEYLTTPVTGYHTVVTGNYAVLSVSDNGIGIPVEYLDQIFEPFFTKKEMGRSGSGLGLAVVWGTVEDHNGYIDVRSQVNEGTQFTLYFPETTRQPSETDARSSILQYMGDNQTILIIDDSGSQREIASEMLRMLGYAVNSVTCGEKAIEYLQKRSADLLLLDMIMAPGMDGLETYQKILQFKPNQKAVITSGYSETERVRQALRLGASRYVKKPYTLEEIGLAVKEVFAKEPPRSSG